MDKEEVSRLSNWERKVMAETAIRDARSRIINLQVEIEKEEREIEKQKGRLAEANAYLKSVGEDIE